MISQDLVFVHGRCWNEGKRGQLVLEWEERKVEEMLAVCLAKYRAHPVMGEELVEGTRGCHILGLVATTGHLHPTSGHPAPGSGRNGTG